MPTAQKVNRPLPNLSDGEVSKPEVSKPQVEKPEPAKPKSNSNSIGGLPITSIDESESHLKFLIFGDAGVGKTVLAASAEEVPEMSPVLFIDAEGGTLSLQGMYQPDVVRVKHYKDVLKILQELHAGNHKYRTVVVDSLSEVTAILINGIMDDKVNRNPSADINMPDFGDWRKYTLIFNKMIRDFRNLDMNVIFTCGVQFDDRNGLRVAYPLMDGKIRVYVRYFLDLVLYMYPKMVGDQHMRLITGTSTNTVAAKNRGYNMPPVIENPTMKILRENILKQQDRKENNDN